jgi:uncharacterized damage-inducible protein DinB
MEASPMKAHFEMMAAYNAWANRRLYAAAAEVADADRRSDQGAFFGGLHQTLNHILVGDVFWMARFRGQTQPKWTLDHIAHDDFDDLRAARAAMDDDIIRYVDGLDEAAIAGEMTFSMVTVPKMVTEQRGPALAHLFNHQTHHRGQCHALLTRLTGAAPALDLIYHLRETTRSSA